MDDTRRDHHLVAVVVGGRCDDLLELIGESRLAGSVEDPRADLPIDEYACDRGVADEQPESARLEVSESTTSLTGESHSDVTDADASMLANDPTFTRWVITKAKYPTMRKDGRLYDSGSWNIDTQRITRRWTPFHGSA